MCSNAPLKDVRHHRQTQAKHHNTFTPLRLEHHKSSHANGDPPTQPPLLTTKSQGLQLNPGAVVRSVYCTHTQPYVGEQTAGPLTNFKTSRVRKREQLQSDTLLFCYLKGQWRIVAKNRGQMCTFEQIPNSAVWQM